MHESNIDLLRTEAQRLLKEEVKLLDKIKETPNLLGEKSDCAQTLDIASLPKAIEQLKGENYKLENLDLVLAVVGTMKAGKSTTINAIVGMEVLPNRNRPMTALPTLIRHTRGVTEPRLTFNNTDPVNQLINSLSKRIPSTSSEIIADIKSNTDMLDLLDRIEKKEPFVKVHVGSNAIFNFLKGLNDLVRLSTALDVAFPFDAYSRIESLPLIEVEFTHLKLMGEVQGRLTLLDTPGPNEAGQRHLRHMLRDQLKKASAVLAVLDYTQLKSDADHEMRKNLEEIAKVTKDRLYALVNKFDQVDRNGDNAEDVSKFVSSTLMKELIAVERVYPVSAKYGYLASKAKNELALNGKLPNHEKNLWVADFAVEAMNPRSWENQLDDIEEVTEAANYLWEKSLFDAPLDSVIRQSYAKAAILAVDSAAAKMVNIAENSKNFLGLRKQAFQKTVKEIQQQVASLQSDIDSILSHEKEVNKDTKSALNVVNNGVRNTRKKAEQNIVRILDQYFKEGKKIEAAKLKDKKNSLTKQSITDKEKTSKDSRNSTSALEGFFGTFGGLFGGANAQLENSKSKDFDSSDKPLKFENKSDAVNLVRNIGKSVDNALNGAEEKLQDDIKQQVEEFNRLFTGYVNKAKETIENIKKEMKDFDLIIRVPDVKAVHLDLAIAEVLDDAAQERTESQSRSRRKSGVWGTVCKWFNTDDWGWEDYSVDVDVYYVDIKKIKKDVTNALSQAFNSMESSINSTIESHLNEQTDSFFIALRDKVENIRGDLIANMSDRKKSQQEQRNLLKNLTKLEKPVPNLLLDAEALANDVKALLTASGPSK